MKTQKNATLVGIFTALAILGLLFAACGDPEGGSTGGNTVSVTGVTLNKTALSLAVGQEETLTPTVTPPDATNKAVSWSSSDTSKATVANGVVKAVAIGTAIITVTTADGGKTVECTVTVTPVLASITVTTPPTKTAYRAGEALDLTGLVVTATYSDDTTEIVTITTEDITGFDSTQPGEQTLTITYRGKIATFKVTVIAVSKIEITTPPTKTAYRAGETLDLTGLVVTATYSDDTTEIVTITIEDITGFNNTQVGEQELTITYSGTIITFTVTVRPFTAISEISEYLNGQTVQTGTIDDPIILPIQLDLGDMPQAGSGWNELLDIIADVDQFVSLNLSTCTMTGTEFNPGYHIETGKNKIVSIALPDMAENIWSGASASSYAFMHFSELKSFSGKNITYIGWYAFYDLEKLEMTTLPASITYIDEGAFSGCTGITQITLPANLTFIGRIAFYNCHNLADISLPASVRFDDNPFVQCYSFNSFTVTGTGPLKAIENGKALVWDNTELISYPMASGNITLPEGITSIGNYTFYGCELTQISLPEGLTSIGNSAFNGSRLAQIDFPESLSSIGDIAFSYTSLKQVTLPANTVTIGSGAFSLSDIALVTCHATTPPTLGTNVFQYTPVNLRIEVPAGSVAAYKAAANWSVYADRIFAIE
jgi:hypothetical protein